MVSSTETSTSTLKSLGETLSTLTNGPPTSGLIAKISTTIMVTNFSTILTALTTTTTLKNIDLSIYYNLTNDLSSGSSNTIQVGNSSENLRVLTNRFSP